MEDTLPNPLSHRSPIPRPPRLKTQQRLRNIQQSFVLDCTSPLASTMIVYNSQTDKYSKPYLESLFTKKSLIKLKSKSKMRLPCFSSSKKSVGRQDFQKFLSEKFKEVESKSRNGSVVEGSDSKRQMYEQRLAMYKENDDGRRDSKKMKKLSKSGLFRHRIIR